MKLGARLMSRKAVGHVAYPQSPLPLMAKLYTHILPAVNEELNGWKERATAIPDAELRKQALASIASKKFHCQGGAVYASGIADRNLARALIAWIVAFQTISDYLDNLCDRSTSLSADDFRSLHQAMLDAIEPHGSLHDYYENRGEQDDGGYLRDLVVACRERSASFPAYEQVKAELRTLVQWYCDLQVHKHIQRELREPALLAWWEGIRQQFPQLYWQEFAAATGSTLGVFCLLTASAQPDLSTQQARQIRESYFPGICGLHILLDYLIDREEDRAGGDLNFCFYYSSEQQLIERYQMILAEARAGAQRLPGSAFHHMIVEGLLALYLSDEKVTQSPQLRVTSRALLAGGPFSRTFFYWNCRLIRRLF